MSKTETEHTIRALFDGARRYRARERARDAAAAAVHQAEDDAAAAGAAARRGAVLATAAAVRAEDERRERAMRAALASPDGQARDRARDEARAARAAKRRAARKARSGRGAAVFGPGVDRAAVTVRAVMPARRVWMVGDDGAAVPMVAHVSTVERFRVAPVAPFVRTGRARSDYLAWWMGADASALTLAARRAARSVRAGSVSDTSRDEAQAAARVALVTAAAGDWAPDVAPVTGGGFVEWHWAPGAHWQRAAQSPTATAAAVAAARASLRGDALGGVTARNGDVTGRAAAADDADGGAVWDLHRGAWVKVRRADGAKFADMAGRAVDEAREPDADPAVRARDAVRLVGWLVRGRLFRMVAERGGPVSPSARASIRRAAARVARVLRAMARGESEAAAVAAVGWTWDASAGECAAWRKAVQALTDGRGLVRAAADWRAECAG